MGRMPSRHPTSSVKVLEETQSTQPSLTNHPLASSNSERQ